MRRTAGFQQKILDWRNGERAVRDVKILDAKIIGVSVEGTRQAVKARFTCTGVRFTKDCATGAIADGSEHSDSFSEFGTFVRPAHHRHRRRLAARPPQRIGLHLGSWARGQPPDAAARR